MRDQLRADPKNARIVAAGPVFTVPDGFVKEVSLTVSSPEDAREKVNKLIDDGADVAIDSFKYFLKLGGAVALGNDSGSMPGVQVGMLIKEILLMQQEAGMTPMQIIEAATRQAARVCRLERELGTLQPGKRADLLVVEGNPLEDLNALTRTRLVIHDGVIIRGE